jgi:hypothetical protein
MENWVRSAKKKAVQPVIAVDFILYRASLPPSFDGSRREAIIGSGIDLQCSKCLQPNHPKAVKPADHSDNGQRSRERLQLLFSAPRRMP